MIRIDERHFDALVTWLSQAVDAPEWFPLGGLADQEMAELEADPWGEEDLILIAALERFQELCGHLNDPENWGGAR